MSSKQRRRNVKLPRVVKYASTFSPLVIYLILMTIFAYHVHYGSRTTRSINQESFVVLAGPVNSRKVSNIYMTPYGPKRGSERLSLKATILGSVYESSLFISQKSCTETSADLVAPKLNFIQEQNMQPRYERVECPCHANLWSRTLGIHIQEAQKSGNLFISYTTIALTHQGITRN